MEEDATYEEKPIQVLDRKEQVLRSKVISLVNILWQYHGMEEATWDLEASNWEHVVNSNFEFIVPQVHGSQWSMRSASTGRTSRTYDGRSLHLVQLSNQSGMRKRCVVL